MKTDKTLMLKGVKFIAYTVALMFLAPFTIYQAFKNQTHPLYWPVLILGIILAIAAVTLGFYGIKIIVDSLFGKRNSRQE